jgi:hypothetical protein
MPEARWLAEHANGAPIYDILCNEKMQFHRPIR